MENGKIILLNGTSSSGKTTIAKALQKTLTEAYMIISIDDHFNKLPEWFWTVNNQDEALIRQKTFSAMISGFHKTIPVLAKSGINVIVDHVFEEKKWFDECVQEWGELEVVFVGIKCPLKIVEKREKERGDRNIETARLQFDKVHSCGLYDIEVDTSIQSVDECAAKIVEIVMDPQKNFIWSAF